MAPSWTERWNRVRGEVAMQDLLLDACGKFLLGVGVGALWAQALSPVAWAFILGGGLVSLAVKMKYWKRFWA